jgi:DNA replication licensing factor MCM3
MCIRDSLEDDLVDSVKPGDRVAVVGVFRPLAGAANGVVSGVYKSVVVGVAAERLTQDKVRWQPRDVRNIRAVAARPWALQLLARSLAPSIYGHDLVKQGLVLLLMGGIERVVNNTHLR